eukprot:scaffold215574_cov32-Tisochrysis_lutea.AAC.2
MSQYAFNSYTTSTTRNESRMNVPLGRCRRREAMWTWIPPSPHKEGRDAEAPRHLCTMRHERGSCVPLAHTCQAFSELNAARNSQREANMTELALPHGQVVVQA